MLRYAHTTGGYFYHPRSWLFLWNDVPLYIPLAWAFIVATSRALTDQIIVRAWARPFSDALLALLIDLSLDVVAIRLGFWTWRGVGLNEAFFGVPADNFLGWLLVTFTFSLCTRRLWNRNPASQRELSVRIAAQWLAVPPLAYVSYLGIEAVVHGGYFLVHADTLRAQLGVLGGVLAVFVAAAWAGSRGKRLGAPASAIEINGETKSAASDRHRRDHLRLHGPRHIFHLFALIGFFCLPLALRSPGLVALTLAVWLLEMSVAWLTYHSPPET